MGGRLADLILTEDLNEIYQEEKYSVQEPFISNYFLSFQYIFFL